MTIRELRKMTGLTQKEFGIKYGIPRRNIENWENGVVDCKAYILNLLEFRVMADLKEQL